MMTKALKICCPVKTLSMTNQPRLFALAKENLSLNSITLPVIPIKALKIRLTVNRSIQQEANTRKVKRGVMVLMMEARLTEIWV